MALAQYGIDYAVAALGTATTPTHVQKLLRQADHVFYCFDGDAAGQRRVARWKTAWKRWWMARRCTFVLPSEHDPDSYVREFGRDAFEQALTRDSPAAVRLPGKRADPAGGYAIAGRPRRAGEAGCALAGQGGRPHFGVMLRRRVAELAQIDLNELDRLTGRTPRFGKNPSARRRGVVPGMIPPWCAG